ncbi:hypothetical protein ACMATS_12920 [Streptoverticillium reticulum]|uniref:hypothetical protein n=1 Tax=Streptoverticillium reticulum TaxID=1433415 RepID=UPI0039BF7BA4
MAPRRVSMQAAGVPHGGDQVLGPFRVEGVSADASGTLGGPDGVQERQGRQDQGQGESDGGGEAVRERSGAGG